jgi:uncharacterized membrane protein
VGRKAPMSLVGILVIVLIVVLIVFLLRRA